MAKKKNKFVEPALESEVSETVETEVKNVLKSGRVFNCKHLNVRAMPNPTAEIVCVLECGTEVMVDDEKSTEDFYSVCTEAGIEGFCMKKFIATL